MYKRTKLAILALITTGLLAFYWSRPQHNTLSEKGYEVAKQLDFYTELGDNHDLIDKIRLYIRYNVKPDMQEELIMYSRHPEPLFADNHVRDIIFYSSFIAFWLLIPGTIVAKALDEEDYLHHIMTETPSTKLMFHYDKFNSQQGKEDV